ncbi:unnamed protein product [Parnassius apollo]|uniref:(apollo) hypothetical protein n=1 Tax=Parnassius apollo TaxID=110799 RepID=A0A8S3WEQ5_PARAO|nr:unnamed protein product [Parnassius apollo]
MVSIMQGEKYANLLKTIPLSSDTVHRRINLLVLADDIKIQLTNRVKGSPYYAIQLDESTDVANVAQLLIFIRYRNENDICEDGAAALTGSKTEFKAKVTEIAPHVGFVHYEISAENYEMFACLEKFSEENNIKLEEEIKTKIMMHLTNLKQDLEIRFPDTSHGDQWIINPFTCDLNNVKMNLK